GDLVGPRVAGVDVADHAHGGVVGEQALELLPREVRAVGQAHLAGVDRAADAHAAAVVDRDPAGSGGGGGQRVQQRPVGDRVGAVEHGLGRAGRGGDGAGVEVVAADDDRGLDLPVADEVVEEHAGLVP